MYLKVCKYRFYDRFMFLVFFLRKYFILGRFMYEKPNTFTYVIVVITEESQS